MDHDKNHPNVIKNLKILTEPKILAREEGLYDWPEVTLTIQSVQKIVHSE